MIDEAACYQALTARDRRFDGVFYVGVRTTGVYCRPVCPARTPGRARCAFYRTAAEAEREGFRACLRCRPELAPGVASVDQVPALVSTAAARIRAGALREGSIDALAGSLGVSGRHLRRAMEATLGVSPMALWQTQRLALARRLLRDGAMPVTEVVFASGFESVRRFNAAFRAAYGCAPSAMRRAVAPGEAGDAISLRLDYRPPLEWSALLDFLRARAVVGVERVDAAEYARTVTLGGLRGRVSVTHDSRRAALVVRVSRSLTPRVMDVVERLRGLFDLDARPDVIAAQLAGDAALAASVGDAPGLRVPGAFDGWETAVRAVLGQQVSVTAATTLCGRLAAALGEGCARENDGLERYFPTPGAVVAAGATRLSALGVASQRAGAIVALARAVEGGALSLGRGADPERVMAALVAIDGIGPWTASYVAMRALGWPDAFVAGDLVVRRALGVSRAAEAERRAAAWRPWRGVRGDAFVARGDAREGDFEMNVRRTMDSPLGELVLVADARGLRGVFLPGQAGDPRGRGATAAQHPILDQAEQELRAYFAGDRRDFTVALSPAGTAFQRRVWEALRGIPFGATRSYGALAAAIGRGGAARAVGSANGQNPLAIVVPCHRVIASTGALAGYAGGLDAKRWLLAHEGRVMNEGAPQAGASAA